MDNGALPLKRKSNTLTTQCRRWLGSADVRFAAALVAAGRRFRFRQQLGTLAATPPHRDEE
jgi:hypothetical protein